MILRKLDKVGYHLIWEPGAQREVEALVWMGAERINRDMVRGTSKKANWFEFEQHFEKGS